MYIPIEANGQHGQIICNVAHRQAGTKIFWHLDDKYLGVTQAFHQMAIAPPGKHTLTLVDARGNNIKISLTVLQKDKPE